jgi:DNA-binding NtrC family response regulator
MQILAIDDEPICLEIIQIALKEREYNIITAESAEKGFVILNNDKNIDLILLDMMLQDMSGLEFIKKIKSNNLLKDIPIIIQSGTDNYDDINNAFDLGVLAHLKKPFSKKALLEAIDNIIEKNQTKYLTSH